MTPWMWCHRDQHGLRGTIARRWARRRVNRIRRAQRRRTEGERLRRDRDQWPLP